MVFLRAAKSTGNAAEGKDIRQHGALVIHIPGLNAAEAGDLRFRGVFVAISPPAVQSQPEGGGDSVFTADPYLGSEIVLTGSNMASVAAEEVGFTLKHQGAEGCISLNTEDNG